MRWWRYGLRGQVVLNLGVVMLFFSLLLGLFATQLAQKRFSRERKRYLHSVSELLQYTIREQLRSGRSVASEQQRSEINRILRGRWLRLWAGVVLTSDGKVWDKFGFLPLEAVPVLRSQMKEGQVPDTKLVLKRVVLPTRTAWDCYAPLHDGKRSLGVLWLRWDTVGMGRVFFTYQGLLLLYLLLFCVLVVLILVVFLERRLIRPLGRLSESMRQLSSWGTSRPLDKELVRSDQIGELARAFQDMERQLQQQASERERYIEELESTNQVLERAQEELVQREKMASVGHLAAGVAHEVGNPLSAIIGYGELLQSLPQLGEMEKDLCERIHKEARRIDLIIRELIDYARPAKDEQPGSPRRSVEECLELLRLQKRFRGMEVSTVLDEHLPLVKTPSNHLVQVLLNLLLNAADACAQNGQVWVKAIFDEEAGLVCLSVADDGPGVREEHRERLFEPFFTTKSTGKGVGLGLAICQRLVMGGGGRLSFEPSEHGGACFIMHLPVLEEHELTQLSSTTIVAISGPKVGDQ